MVEKIGHKKRMQAMRMEWINEGKPYSSVHEDSLFDEPALPPKENGEREKTAPRIAPIFEKRASERPKTPTVDADIDFEMDNLYDATPGPPRQKPSEDSTSKTDSLFGSNKTSIFGSSRAPEDEPPEDELDALLAEEEMLQATSGNVQYAPAVKKAAAQDDVGDDEMEAMAEMDMDDMW
jgi:replication fork protection complex subunit Csm3/Swi3